MNLLTVKNTKTDDDMESPTTKMADKDHNKPELTTMESDFEENTDDLDAGTVTNPHEEITEPTGGNLSPNRERKNSDWEDPEQIPDQPSSPQHEKHQHD